MSEPSSSNRTRAAGESLLKIIYVMGAGRSGSTVLGVALGNCTDVFYAGELDAWLRRSGIPNFDGSERMKFWSIIRDEVSGASGLFGDQAWRSLEHSMALFRVPLWPVRRRIHLAYRQIADDLYRSIAKVAGVTHIVDTSHYPLRARQLRRIAGIDLYLIYLVRDSRNVVASFKRREVDQPSKSTVAANAYLFLTHLLSVLTFLQHRHDRRMLVRYEDFIARPQEVLHNILLCAGISGALPNLDRLRTGVAFQGNRMLSKQMIALQGDIPTRVDGSRVTAALQIPWSVAFSLLRSRGYKSDNDHLRDRIR